MVLHRVALVSLRLFRKNLGDLQEYFAQMVYRPLHAPPNPLAKKFLYAYVEKKLKTHFWYLGSR